MLPSVRSSKCRMTLLTTESSNRATSQVTSMAMRIWKTCSMNWSTFSPK